MEIKIKIQGKTPLLCNRFTDEATLVLEGKTSVCSTAGYKGTPKEIAQNKLYLDPVSDEPIIPQPNIFRCILDAGKFFKAGKIKVTTQKSSLIPACLDMDEISYTILHEDPWEVDSRPVRNPSTGGRVIAHRPLFHDWALEFGVVLDTTIMNENLFRDIVDKAGSAIGLGDFRPDCKGPFGKFVVTKWEIVPLEQTG